MGRARNDRFALVIERRRGVSASASAALSNLQDIDNANKKEKLREVKNGPCLLSQFLASIDVEKWDMIMAERILSKVIDIDNQLEEMGLDRKGLTEAVRFAEHHRSFVTANDPIGFPNYVVYAKLARSLRETYLSKGWTKDDTHNQAAIKNTKNKIRR
jgi:hypothetical protein